MGGGWCLSSSTEVGAVGRDAGDAQASGQVRHLWLHAAGPPPGAARLRGLRGEDPQAKRDAPGLRDLAAERRGG
jgi:hypothetical protein